MFLQVDVIEFLNKIINQSKYEDKDNVKENIKKFRDYLRLTQMCDEATLAEIDIVLDCINELMVLKKKLGNVDVTVVFEGREEMIDKPLKLEKTRQSKYDLKHYKHYTKDTSSSCGASVSRSSSCGSTPVERTSSPLYSSSCGCTPTYRSC